MRMRLCSSMARTVTWAEASYISHSHWTCLPCSNLPLPLVNQNVEVMLGLINASKTSATGLRISISALATGICVSWRFSIDLFLSKDELLLTRHLARNCRLQRDSLSAANARPTACQSSQSTRWRPSVMLDQTHTVSRVLSSAPAPILHRKAYRDAL